MGRLHIEDDDDQLKVPADEIPPVRPADVAAAVDVDPVSGAAKLLMLMAVLCRRDRRRFWRSRKSCWQRRGRPSQESDAAR